MSDSHDKLYRGLFLRIVETADMGNGVNYRVIETEFQRLGFPMSRAQTELIANWLKARDYIRIERRQPFGLKVNLAFIQSPGRDVVAGRLTDADIDLEVE